MTLSEIGAIGELIGGVGVIITLIYLAAQIRQNTKQQQFASSSSLWEGLSRAYDPAYLGENMSTYRKALAGEQITPDEYTTFVFLSFRTFSHFYQIFDSHQKGFIEDGTLVMNRNVIVNFLAAPGVRKYWKDIGLSMFTTEYCEWVESAIPEADKLPDQYKFWKGTA